MKCSALCRSQLFWLNRRKCIQLANLQLLWKASQLFLAISDLVWSGKLHPSPWPRGGGGVAQNTGGGVNWPRCDSKAKSSACVGRLASDYSLSCTIEMEGRPVAPWLSFGGRTAEKGAHMDALTPQPAQGQTGDLKSLYRPEVWRELGAFCCLCPGFRSTAHVDDILFTGRGCMASF